ncbi:MAG: carboxylesterase family protein [Myxococcales bacterium]|nr:carboxylesterase family protein [Myxococcales bacterium]
MMRVVGRILAQSSARRRASALIAMLWLCSAIGCETVPSKIPELPVAESLRHPATGSVIGTHGLYGGFAWRGIPYAAPPIGENRFRAPDSVEPWNGTRRTLRFGASCPQYATSWGGDTSAPDGERVGSEDCLFLNVYAPEFVSSSSAQQPGKLPVMFWIHGGGNLYGTSSFYNGSRLASEQQVVVVTVNYRLGFLGWFRHRALRSDAGPIDASGNFGTLDLIRALEWVQENIEAFGGDPNNVTIFGESAGGWNVVSLLASPLAKGKFHRAIGQSSLSWSTSPARAENYSDDSEPGDESSSGEVLIRLMLTDGRVANREEAKQAIATMDDFSLSRYLREKSVAELFAAYDLPNTDDQADDQADEPDDEADATTRAAEYSCPRMFEDGVVLPSTPLGHAFRAGSRFNRVPVMLGTNKDEEKLFLLFKPEYSSQLFGLIPRLHDRSRYLRDTEVITRIWRMMAVDELAKDLARAMPGEVFSYRFDWDEEPSIFGADIGEMLGAAHGFEIPFVFGHWNLGPDTHLLFTKWNLSGRETLGAAMRSYWTEFATLGHPGKGRNAELPHWAAWTDGAARFAILDTERGGGLRMTEGSETALDIASSIIADSSYRTLRRRCMALAAIHDWAPLSFSVEEYATIGRGLCHAHPIQELLDSF